jgi:hypothetical protein
MVTPVRRFVAYFVYVLGVHVMDALSALSFGLGISGGDDMVIQTQKTLSLLFELAEKIPIDPDTLRGKRAA